MDVLTFHTAVDDKFPLASRRTSRSKSKQRWGYVGQSGVLYFGYNFDYGQVFSLLYSRLNSL